MSRASPPPSPPRPSPPGPDWTRVKAIFLEAVDLPDADRPAFLAAACAGDVELQREVESLLASDRAAESFCETPAAGLLGPTATGAPPLPRLAAGTRLGAYEITGFIAAGGMGEVYRARHSVLGREVAIKTTGMHLDDEAARRRLIREARMASRLAHPNICTIYEVGDVAGVPFIVMEYVAGRTLTDAIRAHPPHLAETLGIGTQIAAALAEAHRHGIVHRDLKSSNVVIDASGRAKVLDFGLARRVLGDAITADSTITVDNVVAGTLSHMAPEVLRGARADERSDIWALGVVLYELATGTLPFTGESRTQITSAILTERPRRMSRQVPLALRLVIERCLLKDPAGRYQQAQAVYDALSALQRRRAWPVIGRLLLSVRRRAMYRSAALILLAAALVAFRGQIVALARASVGSVPTVAMLPLKAADGQDTTGYYLDGITDALISQLGAASHVRVLSRASVARGAAAARTTAELGTRFGADMIVSGTLRRSGDRVAISVRALRPRDSRVLWSETYERDAREILALQADVVRGLALTLQSLRPGMQGRLAAVRAVSPAVYEEYLKGRHEWNKRTRESLQRAITHFNRALALDDSYAPAHAALADCYNQLATVMVGSGAPGQWRPLAAAEALKALRILLTT